MGGEKHPRYKGKIKKYCKYCGKEFEVYAKAKLGVTFCSHGCSALWWGENHCGEKSARWTPKVKKICLNCGKTFEIIPSVDKHGKGKFCSKTCSNEWQGKNAPSGVNHPNWKQKVKKQCKYCGKKFERLESDKWGITFCSRSCFNKWYSENKSGKNSHRWKQITQICIECGKEFTTYPARADILSAVNSGGSPARIAAHIVLHKLSSQRYTDGCARQPLLLMNGNSSNRRYLTS
jgi:ribosomal protein L31